MRVNSPATLAVALCSVLALAGQSQAQDAAQIEGGYELKIRQYRSAQRELDKALREEPSLAKSGVTPEQVQKLVARQQQLAEQIRADKTNDELRAELKETIAAKYAGMRTMVSTEVDNAHDVMTYELRAIPLLERFAERGQEFLRLSRDKNVPPAQQTAYRELYKTHLGAYSRYAQRIRERRNSQAQRMTLALVNARSGFDRGLTDNGDLLQVVQSHKDYADAMKAEFVSDLKQWLDISERLRALLDHMELKEIIESFMQDAGISPLAVHRRQKQRRDRCLANIRHIEAAVMTPVRAGPAARDDYGDDAIDEMSRW